MLNTINLTNEQVDYIYELLHERAKNIKQVRNDNVIFHEYDQLQASLDTKMIESIVRNLYTTV